MRPLLPDCFAEEAMQRTPLGFSLASYSHRLNHYLSKRKRGFRVRVRVYVCQGFNIARVSRELRMMPET